MRNFEKDFYFHKSIFVGSTVTVKQNSVSDQQQINSNTFVKFLPEGGNLVPGVVNREAFRAVGPNGTGTIIKGIVKDENNKIVAEIKTEHLGMGSFLLKPEPNRSYHSMVTTLHGEIKDIPIPLSSPNDLALLCDNSDANYLKISLASRKSAYPVVIIAQSNGLIFYAVQDQLSNGALTGIIPKRRLPTGIVQLTVFSINNQPLAERLVFINNDGLNIGIKTDKLAYTLDDKVKISIDVSDYNFKPAIGSFSISVTNKSLLPFNDDTEETIFSNLLLTSDLKGFVAEPSYYFADTTNLRRANLDLLMLTQGWRRFDWKKTIANSFTKLSFEPEKDLKVSGTVIGLDGTPIKAAQVTIVSITGSPLFLTTSTNDLGHFEFSKLDFIDSAKFVVRAVYLPNKNKVKVILDGDEQFENRYGIGNTLSPDSISSTALEKSYSKREADTGWNVKNSPMLKEIVIKGKTMKAQNSANLNGAGNADAVIGGERLKKYRTLAEGIIYNLPSGFGESHGAFYSTRGAGSVQVVLDGIYADQSELYRLNPADVESVEIIKAGSLAYVYGEKGNGGLFIVTTKQRKSGDAPSKNVPAPNTVIFT
ncbi:carboxypeptidase-like regulatory domain-containing protein [Mucilaginibacter agri]|uniref:TonB-dependent receptor plug domain-containing protein n=1 Tax=Mucilaginibacter agri TaxID=2695265 RepID=A0A965ZD05_9SPHI|nr:carboxypeptidase-like regulatory domain-containing protein [Mucilaginibacter agri]NCD68023.1 TonB-dependent receptor plug domain-containing protein [Mucilaginibacter agri]